MKIEVQCIYTYEASKRNPPYIESRGKRERGNGNIMEW
jgi:hypothetical protein